MLVLLSPAKSLDMERSLPSSIKEDELTSPSLLNQSAKLIDDLRKLDVKEIAKTLSISEQLAELNHGRYQDWSKAKKQSTTARPAIAMFDGDVYRGFDIATATAKQIRTAQDRVRILSGLYGVIRPLDVIRAYRLEMGSKISLAGAKNLYSYWGDQLAEHLMQELPSSGGESVIVNLASNEYFKAANRKALDAPVVSPRFLDQKPGKDPKVISFFAKAARGSMARWIVDNEPNDTKALSKFNTAGYKYSSTESTPSTPTFIRRHSE